MALQKTITLSCGLVAENAYHRIDSISGPKEAKIITVAAYASKNAHESGAAMLEGSRSFEFTRDLQNDTWAQAYTDLKTLPEFADAVDC